MPEGDTVWRTAARLRTVLAGKTLTRCDIRVPRAAELDFTGAQVDSVTAAGKHLLIQVAGHAIHTHLRMDGSWQTGPPSMRWRWPAHQARIILGVSDALAIGFSLGLVEVLTAAGESALLRRLGPDPLGPQWDPAEAGRRLAAAPGRPIGLALLDQHNIAGIGNIYRSEICFDCRIDPRQDVSEVADLNAITAAAHRIMFAAAHRPPWRNRVYGRHRQPCLRCGTTIERHPLGGPPAEPYAQRWIYLCPHCQPLLERG